jgi:amidohydrolase
MQAVFGMHNWPGYPAGTLAVSPGPVMASANTFMVTVRGRGSHAALPHDGIDPMPVACQIVQAFQSVVSRNTRPIDTAVVSVTMIHGGEATNVVPDTCVVEGTVRTFRTEVLDLIEARMETIARQTSAAFGAGCEFEFVRRAPALVNHAREALFAARVMAGIVGDDRVLVQEPALASEDFAFMLQVQAGCYCFIGNGDGAHRASGHGEGPCLLHNPSYDFNDALIPLGATYWVRLAEAWLAAEHAP